METRVFFLANPLLSAASFQMDSLRNLISLIPELFEGILAQSLPSFWMALMGGVFLAAALWVGTFYVTWLWNRKYRLRLWHHLLCGMAAVVTFAAVPTWVVTSFMKDTAKAVDRIWQERLADEEWQQKTFARAFRAVEHLEREDFADIPPPGEPGSRIPLTDSASVRTVAAVYARSAAAYLSEHHPQLSLFIQHLQAEEAGRLDVGTRALFEEAGVLHPFEQTARAAVAGAGVIDYVQAWAWKARLWIAGLFLATQLLAVGSVSVSAGRDIRVHT